MIHAKDIIARTAGQFGLTPADIVGHDRHKTVALARHIAMYLVRERTTLSFPEIGRLFGNRDHTTAMNGVTKVRELLATGDARTLDTYREILARVEKDGKVAA